MSFLSQGGSLFPCLPAIVFFTKSSQMFFASSLYKGDGRKMLCPQSNTSWNYLLAVVDFYLVNNFQDNFPLCSFTPPPNLSPPSIMNLDAAESCRSDLACKNVSQSKQNVLFGLECSKLLWITGLVFAKWKAISLAKKYLWGYLWLLAHRENVWKLSREKDIVHVYINLSWNQKKKKAWITAFRFQLKSFRFSASSNRY